MTDLLRLCTTALVTLFRVSEDHRCHHLLTLTAKADVFHNVGPTTQLALLPQENSIFGTVTETYDLLRSSAVGESKWIRGAVTLSIQHCLVVRRGKTLPEIQRVLSHEQVRRSESDTMVRLLIASHQHNRPLGFRTVPEIYRDPSAYGSTRQRSFDRCGCRSSLDSARCRQ